MVTPSNLAEVINKMFFFIKFFVRFEMSYYQWSFRNSLFQNALFSTLLDWQLRAKSDITVLQWKETSCGKKIIADFMLFIPCIIGN